MNQNKTRKNRVVSLRFKIVAAIILAALILSAIAVTISYNVYSNTMDQHYKTLTSNLAKTAASQLDADSLLRYYNEVKQIGEYDEDKYQSDDSYRSEYDAKADALKDDEYFRMLNILFEIKDSNKITYKTIIGFFYFTVFSHRVRKSAECEDFCFVRGSR